jgi:hypothetical protein
MHDKVEAQILESEVDYAMVTEMPGGLRVDLAPLQLGSQERRRLGTGTAEYPLHRSVQDPNFATQSHRAQMDALERATHDALRDSHLNGDQVRARRSPLLQMTTAL